MYQSIEGSKLNILLKKKDGLQVLVSFRGNSRTFRTGDEELQGLIEGHRWFGENWIAVIEETQDNRSKEIKPDPLTFVDVTDIQGAIDVLVTEFGVKETKLKTPDQVKKAAAEHNVSFPNLSL